MYGSRRRFATSQAISHHVSFICPLQYDIYGHSGETYREEFVNVDKPPKNNNERLMVLKTILAHAQFCISGDHTFEAAKHHIQAVGEEEADEHFVILLSDANFDRYGLRPTRLGEILTSNEDVNAYAIFIGSLGDQAIRLVFEDFSKVYIPYYP